MKQKKLRDVHKKIQVINSNTTYWDSLKNSTIESSEANPDNLTDEVSNKPWGNNTPKLAKILIDEFMDENGDFPILSKQENLVLRLYTAGRSLGQIALELKPPISKSTVVVYLKRISKKFRKLIKPFENEL